MQVGRLQVSWKRQLRVAVSGKTELLQHSTGGDEASHAGQVEQPEHTRNLKAKTGKLHFSSMSTHNAFKMGTVLVNRKAPAAHLSKVLVDGCEGLTPCRLLQEHAEIRVGEPAPFHSLTRCNADHTGTSQTLHFLFHIYTCHCEVSHRYLT